MGGIIERLAEMVAGPEPVRWTGDLYGDDVEFTLAVDDGVPPSAWEAAAAASDSKSEFRERVLDAYYDRLVTEA